MRKVILAAALMMIGGTAVASAQEPTTPPKSDSAAKWSHDSAMKQGAMKDTAMKQAGQVASVNVNTATRLQPRSGDQFLRPREIVPPRIAEFGLAYNF